MAKKVISDEVIYDSDADAGMSTDSEAERELEQAAVEFVPPRRYTKKTGGNVPNALEDITKKQQVWLIKLPADVDVSKISSIPLNAGEEASLKIDGKSYSITEEIPSSKNKKGGFEKFNVLVPSAKGDKFRKQDVNITRFLDIAEKVKIPEINYGKVVVQREDVEKEENLRMRHFPTGYYIKDFEEAQEPVVPGPSGKKRSHDDVADVEDEKHAKKSKKDKKEKKDKKDKKEKKEKKEKKSKKDRD